MRSQLGKKLSARDVERLERAGELAAELGMRLFLAGGTVRDVILGRSHLDWDLAVEGDGPGYAQALAEAWGGEAVVHERFLTATVKLPDGNSFDIATARRETYPKPGALPVVEAAPIEDDLWRRDFSINAIAVALSPDDLYVFLDPTGGLGDLDHKLVRALHPRSFWDDATRIIRAIGFEQRLGFAIEPRTESWIREAAAGGALWAVSTERLGEALLPLLGDTVGPRVLRRGVSLGVAQALGTRTAFTRRTLAALDEAPTALEQLGEQGNPASRVTACLAALLLSRTVSAEAIIGRLHLDRLAAKELRAAERYLGLWPAGFAPADRPGELWAQLRETSLGGVLALWLGSSDAEAREALARYWRTLRDARPDIGADEFAALGYQPGPTFAEALRAATRAKLNDNANLAAQLAAARRVLDSEHKA